MNNQRFQLLVLSVMHGFVHGVMNIFPVVLPAIRETFDWSLSTVGWAGTTGYVVFGLMALPGGWIADRVPRWTLLRLMIGGMSGSLILVFSWTTEVGFLVGWTAVCLFAGLYHPLGLSSVVESSGDSTGRAMGWHGFGGNIGFAIVPVVAGLVASSWTWPAAFLVAGGVAVVLGFLSLCTGDTASEHVETKQSLGWSRRLFLVLILYGFVGFVYRGMVTFVPASMLQRWSGSLGLGGVGLFTTLIYSVGAFGQLAGGWLEDSCDSLVLFGTITAGYTAIVALLSITAGVPFIVLLCGWAGLYFAGQPILNTLVSRMGIPATHGRLYGLAFTMNLGLGASGAGVVGSLMEAGGLNAGYAGILTGGLLILMILWALSRSGQTGDGRE